MRPWQPTWQSGTTRQSCAGATGAAGGQNSGTGKHLIGVARAGINRTNGPPLMLAVGDDGTCLRFVDDGEWQSLSTGTSRDLNAVSFAPKTRVAWVGDDGTILKTTNGGSSFGVQTSNTTKHLHSVWAVDEHLVYACGDGVGVWRTEDGGSTWEKIHHGIPRVALVLARPSSTRGISTASMPSETR